jgi:acetyltransferase-like isoleucine patch superfamily enzyme
MNLRIINDYAPSIEVVHDTSFDHLTFNLADLMRGTLTFAATPDYLAKCVAQPNVSAAMTTREIFDQYVHTGSAGTRTIGIALTPRPREEFFRFHNWLCQQTEFYHRPNRSERGTNCRIGTLASIDDHNVVLGDNVIIEDFVRINANTTIGDNAVIGAGTIVGSDGFQVLALPSKELLKVTHAGGVRIGKGVEVLSNCAVARHIFNDDTTIGDDSKIDNLVHVAHAVKLGRRCRIAANAMIGGSALIGDDVWIGPSASISSEVVVKDGAYVTLGSVVTRTVEANERVTGNFAVPHDRFIRFIKTIR